MKRMTLLMTILVVMPSMFAAAADFSRRDLIALAVLVVAVAAVTAIEQLVLSFRAPWR